MEALAKAQALSTTLDEFLDVWMLDAPECKENNVTKTIKKVHVL